MRHLTPYIIIAHELTEEQKQAAHRLMQFGLTKMLWPTKSLSQEEERERQEIIAKMPELQKFYDNLSNREYVVDVMNSIEKASALFETKCKETEKMLRDKTNIIP